MRIVRYGLLCLCLMSVSFCFAQKEDWLPITEQDLQLKDVPGDPGAPAIQLYYANFIDDSNRTEFIYHRIKILTEKGKRFANVEILVRQGMTIRDLKARTVKADGSILDFVDKPFEKTIFKGHGIKVLAKTFTLPDVNVGSIVEYKFKQDYEHSFTSDNWVLQHNLFTMKENFSFKPYTGALRGMDFEEGSRLGWVGLHLSKEQQPQMDKNNNAQLELRNIPGFEPEEYMPPEKSYQSSVHFFYVRPEIKTTEGYWDYVGKHWCEFFERFIDDHKETKEAAMEAIQNESDPEKKLRKVYARAQQIRNLSYERRRSAEERQKEQLKVNDSASETLKHGFGDARDIVIAFVAMARAAGFDASILAVSNRREEFFYKEVLSARQLDGLIVDVKVNGKDIYLDPGTKFCPFGLIRWMRTSTQALRLDKKSPTFVTIPPARFDRALIRRSINGIVEEGGSLKADLVVNFEGTEALERRLEGLQADDAGRKKQLEDEVRSWLTDGAIVKLTDVQGWEGSEEPLSVHFSIELADYASRTGKRLLVPSYLFRIKRKDAFAHTDRKYPVYFAYAFTEIDSMNLEFPADHTVESAPQALDSMLPFAAYRKAAKIEGNHLVMERLLELNGIYFPVASYSEVKNFFSEIQEADEQQAVLRLGERANTQKPD